MSPRSHATSHGISAASPRMPLALLLATIAAACDAGPRASPSLAAADASRGGLVADSAAAFTVSPASVRGGLARGEGNPDQAFLRRLVAQQESLAWRIDALVPSLASPVATAQAVTVRDRLGLEYQVSVGLLRDWFAETHDADRVPRSDGGIIPPTYRADMAAKSFVGVLPAEAVDTSAATAAARGGMADTALAYPGMPRVVDADAQLRAVLAGSHRAMLDLTEAYWPHLLAPEIRALAVRHHRQSRLELAALERRDATGAGVPSGARPVPPISGTPKAGLDDRPASANRATVPGGSAADPRTPDDRTSPTTTPPTP